MHAPAVQLSAAIPQFTHAAAIVPQVMILQFSRDGVLREKYMIDDPAQVSPDGNM